MRKLSYYFKDTEFPHEKEFDKLSFELADLLIKLNNRVDLKVHEFDLLLFELVKAAEKEPSC